MEGVGEEKDSDGSDGEDEWTEEDGPRDGEEEAEMESEGRVLALEERWEQSGRPVVVKRPPVLTQLSLVALCHEIARKTRGIVQDRPDLLTDSARARMGLPVYATQINSANPAHQLPAAEALSRATGTRHDPLWEEVRAAHLLPRLFALALAGMAAANANPKMAELVNHCLAVGVNLTSSPASDMVWYVAECGGCEVFARALESSVEPIYENGLYAFNNMVSEARPLRDALLRSRALESLLVGLPRFARPAVRRMAAACIECLLDKARDLPWAAITPAIPALVSLANSPIAPQHAETIRLALRATRNFVTDGPQPPLAAAPKPTPSSTPFSAGAAASAAISAIYGHSAGALSQEGISTGAAALSHGGISTGVAAVSQGGISTGVAVLSQEGISRGVAAYSQEGISRGVGDLSQGAISRGVGDLSQGGISRGVGDLSQGGISRGVGDNSTKATALGAKTKGKDGSDDEDDECKRVDGKRREAWLTRLIGVAMAGSVTSAARVLCGYDPNGGGELQAEVEEMVQKHGLRLDDATRAAQEMHAAVQRSEASRAPGRWSDINKDHMSKAREYASSIVSFAARDAAEAFELFAKLRHPHPTPVYRTWLRQLANALVITPADPADTPTSTAGARSSIGPAAGASFGGQQHKNASGAALGTWTSSGSASSGSSGSSFGVPPSASGASLGASFGSGISSAGLSGGPGLAATGVGGRLHGGGSSGAAAGLSGGPGSAAAGVGGRLHGGGASGAGVGEGETIAGLASGAVMAMLTGSQEMVVDAFGVIGDVLDAADEDTGYLLVHAAIQRDLLPIVILFASMDDACTHRTLKEVVYPLRMAAQFADGHHVRVLAGSGLFKALARLLARLRDSGYLIRAVDALRRWLLAAFPQDRTELTSRFEEHGGREALESLKAHKNDALGQAAEALLHEYFNEDDDNMTHSVPQNAAAAATTTHTAQSFGFGFQSHSMPS
jgi:hypothetical protein